MVDPELFFRFTQKSPSKNYPPTEFKFPMSLWSPYDLVPTSILNQNIMMISKSISHTAHFIIAHLAIQN